ENNKAAPCWNRDVIFQQKKPFKKNSGIAVLRGNLCPDGAIIKPSAATPKLMKHRGRAVVFENIEDFHKRIDDPKLAIDKNSVMVLKNCGPKGYPRSEEHTSELQSRFDLVCRLLLEKKKNLRLRQIDVINSN